MSARERSKTAKATVKKQARKRLKTPGLDKLKKEYAKEYGGSHMISGNDMSSFDHVSTGIFELDLSTLGGLQDHYPSLLVGWQGSGKSVSAAKLAAEHQKKYPDMMVAWVDIEMTQENSKEWMVDLGVDLSRLIIIKNLVLAESYINAIYDIIHTGEVSLIVIDSVKAMIPKDLDDKSADENQKMGRLASLVGTMCSNIAIGMQRLKSSGKHVPTVAMVNQQRQNMNMFGSDIDIPGGKAQLYFTLTHIRFYRGKSVVAKGTKEKRLDDKALQDMVIMRNHSFKNIRSKSGEGRETGDFTLVVSKAHPYLKKGDIDDTKVIIKHAKATGLRTGTGANQRCSVFGDMKLNDTELMKKLLLNPYEKDLLKASIVAVTRQKAGLAYIPPDGTLMRMSGSDIMHLLGESKLIVE